MRVRGPGTWALPAAALCDAGGNALHLWLTEAPRFGVGYLCLVSGPLSVLGRLLLVGFGLLVVRALLRAETCVGRWWSSTGLSAQR